MDPIAGLDKTEISKSVALGKRKTKFSAVEKAKELLINLLGERGRTKNKRHSSKVISIKNF